MLYIENTLCSTDEAGYYLSTYKQFEHKPPDLIKERVDKDYYSMLRTALTNINKVNKTDVEILRTSVGVRTPISHRFEILTFSQSFADIAKATSDQLLKLPGFGQVKVKRLKDAFEKPFRTSSTNAISSQAQALSQTSASVAGPSTVDKGKGKETATNTASEMAPPPRPREPSPAWDIELDLNDFPSPGPDPPPSPRPPQPETSLKRPASPVWDIELDLNESDVDEDIPRKRHKTGDMDVDGEFRPTDLL